ncbi:hypothetical protein [Streptomyces sp. NPDC086023]|uniref:hypothetical protein n=1 Tax=Streptomyces sp. NPDC086023 TaxID=3365746 RepID=UPI0037D0C4BA
MATFAGMLLPVAAGSGVAYAQSVPVMTKTTVGEFAAGQPGTYEIVVSNAGGAEATEPLFFLDALPDGVTATQVTFSTVQNAAGSCLNAYNNINTASNVNSPGASTNNQQSFR